MKKAVSPSTRLWVLLAREAPVAAIFRRGPTRQVQLIKWNLNDDSFEKGQWFKGRIYERRCDLSPGGTLLIYFAATYKGPIQSWTAVSKLPWFTAVALWPKGDGWNGGGYFKGPYEIHLDHFPEDSASHPDFQAACRKFRVTSHANWRGEDAPVWEFTLERDGWSQSQPGAWHKYGEVEGYSWKARVPQTWVKGHAKLGLSLEMSINGIHQQNGPWYDTTYRVVDASGTEIVNVGTADWANWDKSKDLLFARHGRLFRQTFSKREASAPRLLTDFSSNKFEAIEPPEWARKL